MPKDRSELPPVEELLTAAVTGLGGVERPGQVKMAQAVGDAIESEEHLAVQAGTGTGKSLAYLVPAIRHAAESGDAVVVSTATIALQRQLVDRDLPRLADALESLLPHRPEFAILKGRRNYLCRHKMAAGMPEDEDDQLFDPREVSATGRMVQRIQDWANETETGDRDEIVPGVSDQAWRQFSVTARECLGAQRCPSGADCFAELARERAGEADVVVTNHALLAIDAMEDFAVLPEHDVVVVDEAHELVDRVTSVVTGELSESTVSLAVRRAGRLIEQGVADRLQEAGEDLRALLAVAPPGRVDTLPQSLGMTLALVRDAAFACITALGPRNKDKDDPENAGLRKAAFTALDEVHDTAQRMLDAFGPASGGDGAGDDEDMDSPGSPDSASARDSASSGGANGGGTDVRSEEVHRAEVVWLEEGRGRIPPTLRVAPLSVGGMLRDKLFGDRTVVLTSATLALGGTFDSLSRQWGLRAGEWTGLDVGSPFDHPRRGILYVATHLPQPGRDGLPEAYVDEIAELIEAAGGRTLGLFSSMRAAKAATEALRERLDVPLLCQGDDSTSQLVKQFAGDPATCLFGTLSLWQGVDVPGPSLTLVIIDRIPFPRPDDPLASARQRHVAATGGNGFMAVAATHAALLLAQGAGRLLRSMDDRGVVAVLDPRLATARYSGFLLNSLPPFWRTTDPAKVRDALRRLTADA
ncbi:ATP-dependent DNA helicase DinG [Microbispora rosea]|uniref:ATP-dependent helicase DinG n=1 Tax=Microbispora rosea TaxID=58117 RepID=A0A1N6ZRQ1_9ACTN|nr:ATP-dependent DNA helicase [Microbispora rosea]GIH47774.1 ATP-dependent DNA helicase DinG [Microbispora rosea subsp. rosea]SIR29455.1 ATP-dependent DNA helicase DinG [Microbispora rosea]